LNHLAHFFLASANPELMVGGFLGDFVKGPLKEQFPPDIMSGIRLHRAIDAFTDQHYVVKQSHRRFNKEFRRFAPIICDIVYDHFLARQWSTYSDDSLKAFSTRCYETVLSATIPQDARHTLERMEKHKALTSYADEVFIGQALTSISGRLKRANPLARGFKYYEEIRVPLNEDFQLFMPELIKFVGTWQANYFTVER